MVRADIGVDGTVQGVGFRPFVYRNATKNNLSGWVRNLGSAGVEIVLEGDKKDINFFVETLKKDNPPLSSVDEISISYKEEKGLEEFLIKDSSEKSTGSGVIPPDTAICERCLDDMRNSDSRFYNYWATSCVDCGPRFTVIKQLPYDRETTSMNDFNMCDDCKEDYKNPSNRRYHAQTIACPKCGPKIFLDPNNQENPIKEAADRLKQGQILAIKGTGGTHLACETTEDTVKKLRKKLDRPNQPFAIMSPSLSKTKEFAKVNKKEKSLLKCIKKPIVVLRKKQDHGLPKQISPDLHTIGVMLPYSGLHHLLFDHMQEPLIMTSANPPGTPMYIENGKIKDNLDDIADSFLLHNRKIVSRCDDSVIRVQGEKTKFLRRSRGYAPSPISLDIESDPILALGGELDNTIAIYEKGKCYISQYIGDIDNLKTFNYLKKSINHLLDITGIDKPKNIVCDLHPKFRTTKYAEKLGNPIKIQHHHAHIASILGEKNLCKEIIGIALDGVGYGSDKKVWGGEILVSTREESKKMGGLTNQPMPGGDLATKYPARMLAGILYPDKDLEQFLKNYYFPHGEKEIKNIIKQLKNSVNTYQTSSSGRFLDAVSAMLRVCEKRTYEGEPAMKLEKVARQGNSIDLELEYIHKNKKTFLDTKDLLIKLKKQLKTHNREDIAATAQKKMADGLGKIAVKLANKYDIKRIGLSGGVTYNSMITREIEEIMEKNDLDFLINQKIPPGDGGISFGQIVSAGSKLS